MSYVGPSDPIELASRGALTTIALDAREDGAVARAVAHLAGDLADACGARTSITAEVDRARIVVGTLGSPAGALAESLGIDLDPLRDGDRPAWEAYVIHAIDDRLFILGSDRRGAIFGIYDLCRAAGVSPWRWFADVPVRTSDRLSVSPGRLVADRPSVKYRGIFINDEEELEAWARTHTADGTIGPELYEKVFELLLRLRANHIWPAMHVNHFNGDPRSGRLAEDMGIVIGTSHCDMLTRSNQNEWAPWLAERGEDVEYDYSIPGSNREALRDYWRGGIEQNRDYEIAWTVGMRGIHDSGFVTAAIDADESLSPAQKADAKRDLLASVMHDQLGLLDQVVGPDTSGNRLTTFVPYKEVLGLYDAGLPLPDDVTVIWADDNFGYVRRFPTPAEAARGGGNGLYYHSSYWSQPPRSYLFISSTPLAHMKHELRKAWDHGIRTLWVNNVGAIKPLEQDLEFFVQYAWEVGRESTTADVDDFTAGWVDGMFSGGHGTEVADLLRTYAQVTNVRKVEHLTNRAFDQTSYGDEAARRLATLRDLYDRVNTVLESLPPAEQDAFFELVAMKVHASYLSAGQFAYADRSLLAYDQGKRVAADRYLEISRAFEDNRRAMIAHYNTVMADGRWDGILTPEQFAPPTTALLPAARPALALGASGLGVTVWGQDASAVARRLTLSPHSPHTMWIEVFPTGGDAIEVTIESDPWIEVERPRGPVAVEQRLAVRLLDSADHPRSGRIVVTGAGESITVDVTAEAAVAAAPGSRIEADGALALLADEPSIIEAATHSSWFTVPGVGRNQNALLAVSGDPRDDADGGARAGFRIHLRTPGAHLLELHRFPTLDSTGRIRLGVAADDRPAVVVESDTTDEKRGTWWDVVVENVEKLTLRLPFLDAGEHTLWLEAIDRHVALSKLVIYTDERRTSALGPLAALAVSGSPAGPDPDPAAVDLDGIERTRADRYRVDLDAIEPPAAVFAPADFWSDDTTFKVPPRAAQPRAAAPAESDPRRKDLVGAMPRGPVAQLSSGAFAIEAEWALRNDAHAYITASLDSPAVAWRHTHAETAGRAGLAMHVDQPRRRWVDPTRAPGLHYSLEVSTPGEFHVWALVKYDSHADDGIFLAVDGMPQPLEEQSAQGAMYTFGTQQVWVWAHVSTLALAAGPRTLSVIAHEAGLRVDRLYLTLGDERPPLDAEWPQPASPVHHLEGES
ncbi:glycosyl hydrolase 115 family protein [Demequina sp. SYSU T00068]|uniref:glycosyl hydrolase 115 family protein n=1 Tax=Demequina lignilytica TaxID=3051663 RepID=UPI0026140ECA|nr:glycosyl hydrolase 115 family protein [Demequina sp. SYSU T00068]MDN4489613.1 glycosyl hydrolase 115 family protein [Demequina sp. SYSU T00068]